MSQSWLEWESRIAGLTNQKERYTGTLLRTLRLLLGAPFEWTLTGGTALQAYLAEGRRRYSTDIEIMTLTPAARVSAWLTKEGIAHTTVQERNVIVASLTPHGTLFVFHTYPPADYALAQTRSRPFHHFPIKQAPPPSVLDVPMASIDFLLATKLFFLQKEDRGGERTKDVSDLHQALHLGDPGRIRTALDGFLRHYGSSFTSNEVVRRAGVRVRVMGTGLYAEFTKWHAKMLPAPASPPTQAELQALVERLERLGGQPIRETLLEVTRAMLHQMSLKKLGQVAAHHGYRGKTNMEAEKMIDFVATTCLPGLAPPMPTTTDELYERLKR